ncbi:MAG: hypothetical protein OEU92_14915, partial [Alphaproteobacteria bacterium]|nr:hypothetical protein [Alphaproteobacteria bacterium]
MLEPGTLTRFGRDFLVVLAIAIGLVAAVEGAVRLAFNERTQTDYKNDVPTARKDPVLGHINNPGTEASIVGPEFTVDYKITEQGFRNRAVFAPTPEENTTRVLLLGDSFTFGHGSHYQDIWPTLVVDAFEAEGKKVEIINAGVPGFSTTQEVLYLERLHQQYDPDIVMFGFLAHDVITNVALDRADEVLEVSDAAAKSIGNDKKSSLHAVALLQRLLMANDWLYS